MKAKTKQIIGVALMAPLAVMFVGGVIGLLYLTWQKATLLFLAYFAPCCFIAGVITLMNAGDSDDKHL